ncbi:MAG TPA: hypothetical protein EYG86_05470 [Crocinitomicaceae bacterium]|nr:hypothetical protein [Crocinitomicaceae bacterium]
MKILVYSIFTVLLFAFSACIEIIDDITINEDGSGTFKYTVNLSSSKVKINSILALDSLDGKKVPSLKQIQEKLTKIISELKKKDGITNVHFTSDYSNFIFKLNCDFNSLDELQIAIKDLAVKENNGKEIPELNHSWISYQNDSLVRSVPQITVAKTSKINQRDSDLLKEGHYTSITRFSKEVDSFSNGSAKLSKNKKAVMVRANPYLLTKKPQLLDNVIYLAK